MAQTYTLEEAADKLNLSVDEFKRRLNSSWTKVHKFRDGATLRFRTADIDELARTIGLGSSEELPLADASPLDDPSDAGLGTKPKAKGDSDAPLNLDDSDEVFLLAPDAHAGGSGSGKSKPKGDSDVRLEKASKKAPPASGEDDESILTEEMEAVGQGGSGKLSGKSGKLSSAKLKSGDSGKHKAGDSGKHKAGDSGAKKKASQPAEEDSSEFELTLDSDSDEFELSLAPDSSEEVALGEAPAQKSGSKTGNSGINLNRPADSGVSLEKKRKPKPDDEEVDFELSLDAPGTGSSRKKLGSGKKLQADSDSEFELTLEEPSDLALDVSGSGDKKGDIFEATDFEIPALEDDSASEAVSLEEGDTDLESSDFDLALDDADAAADDESASEVVELDDEDVAKARKRKKKRKAAGDDDDAVDLGDLEEGASASAALRGVRHDDDSDEYEVSEAVDEGSVAVAAPAKWGALPAILMFPTVIIMFLGGLMAFELLHSVWGYQQNAKPTTPLVSFFAETAGMKPAQ
jgi:hypothetical protein